MMSMTAMMQLYGSQKNCASSCATDERQRSRTISCETARKLSTESSDPVFMRKDRLYDAIKNLQNNGMRGFLDSPAFRSDRRHGVASALFSVLTEQRKALEGKDLLNKERIAAAAQFVSSSLTNYKSDALKVVPIVASQQFKSLEAVCSEINS